MALYLMDSDSYGSAGRFRGLSKRKWIAQVVFMAAVGIGLGVIIGWFSKTTPAAPEPDRVCLGPDVPSKIIEDGEEGITQLILDNINADNIREYLRRWTAFSHLGGDEGETRLANELYEEWVSQGLDHVTRVEYDVLLSYPNYTDLSYVELLDSTGQNNFTSQIVEEVISGADNNSNIVPPFNAYSATGDPQGGLVYVNYGRIDDFNYIRDQGINLSGKIVIARYGKIFRADKVALADEFGAIGCILYTDPFDYSIPNVDPYPESWWLPDTGVQRGTVYRFDGDPLTPGYPSTASAYRVPDREVQIPRIPTHPISFGDAEKFLRMLGGSNPAPDDSWKGGLNIAYNIGPDLLPEYQDWSVKMHITTYNERRNTTNVFGFIKGSVEPDRYVLVSNHRDAWVFGAVDPTSGTSVMAELSRVLMNIVKNNNWRPRRTIVFASWGAEEYGLTGSYEWVENFIKTLQERTVACLNVDMCLQGNDTMRGLGVPLLYHAMYDVAKKIVTPNDKGTGKTMYDEWLEFKPGTGSDGNLTGYPSIGSLGSGSDFAGFIVVAGIPAVDVRYDYDSSKWSLSSYQYPLYHSAYETFYLVEKYIDPDFKYSAAIGKYWGEMTRYLSDSLVLPMNASMYGQALEEYTAGLQDGYGELMANNSITLNGLRSAITRFQNSAKDFHTRLENIDTTNPLLVRQYNDQLMLLERAFTDPAGLPTRPLYKHVLYAPSQHDAYSGATFPGLVDLMFEIEQRPDKDERWEQVRKHLAAIVYAVDSAGATLKETWLFND